MIDVDRGGVVLAAAWFAAAAAGTANAMWKREVVGPLLPTS